MTDDVPPRPGDGPDSPWLLEPIGPREVRFYVQLGEEVDVSPEARQALEVLIREFQDTDVEGFGSNWEGEWWPGECRVVYGSDKPTPPCPAFYVCWPRYA